MGLIESRNPVGLALLFGKNDDEFNVASINSSISELELVGNVILNKLANHNRAPNQLIKKRAENERKITAQLKTQMHFKYNKHTESGHPIQNKNIHLINLLPITVGPQVHNNQNTSTSSRQRRTTFEK